MKGTLYTSETMNGHLLYPTKIYSEIELHRRYCEKWKKEFCTKCFGRGLTEFAENLLIELEEANEITLSDNLRKKVYHED